MLIMVPGKFVGFIYKAMKLFGLSFSNGLPLLRILAPQPLPLAIPAELIISRLMRWDCPDFNSYRILLNTIPGPTTATWMYMLIYWKMILNRPLQLWPPLFIMLP